MTKTEEMSIMLSEQEEAFEKFYKSARENDVLDPKTTLMIHLAAGMAVGCYPCMQFYMGQAEEAGLTEEEIGTVMSIVMAVSSGRVMAQFRDAMDMGDIPKNLKPCGC